MEAVRTYGDIHGLSEENYERIRPSIPYDQIKYEKRGLHVDYEGHYIDVESFLDEVVKLLDEDGWGKVDFIDHVEWKMTRYILRPGEYDTHHIRVDNVLDAMD